MREDCVLLGMECVDQEEALRTLAQTLIRAGAVKESFPEAVVNREKAYPTGLPAVACDIAVPHTVGEHVLQPQMAVGVLKEPVEFRQMGSPEITLHPKIIIMMAINDPKEQVALLKKLMGMIRDSQVLLQILEATDPKDVVQLVDRFVD